MTSLKSKTVWVVLVAIVLSLFLANESKALKTPPVKDEDTGGIYTLP